MQFKVPQFIDVEDKLFGPFTFHQFAYLAGGGGLIFVIYKLLGFWGIIIIIPVAILTFLLVFYRINDKPFIFYLQAGANYFISSKLYIWKQRIIKTEDKTKEQEIPQMISTIPTTVNKLKDLAWSLDVQKEEEKRG